MSAEPTDPLTGLPASFARMLAREVNPLDNFFAQLMRTQSFRARAREAAEAFGGSNRKPTAMNSLTKTETKTELAPIGLSDPLEAYADAVAPRFIIGDLLRFSKGDYLAGESGRDIPLGTTYTAALTLLMAGWVKWQDSKPVEHIMVRVNDGKTPPKRAELGDHDETKWETDVSGDPRDPWAFTNYLPLMDDKGELYTFTTSSRGGIGAIAGLARRYANHRRRHPDVFPVISLGVDSYAHKNKEFGRIKFPVFAPAGYEPKTKFLEALAAAGVDTGEPQQIEAETAPLDDDISDTIPY
jgi:hypothetical protein